MMMETVEVPVFSIKNIRDDVGDINAKQIKLIITVLFPSVVGRINILSICLLSATRPL